MEWMPALDLNWLWILAVVLAIQVAAASWVVGHVLIHKESPRSAFGWISAAIGFVIVGPLFYVLFGVNRVHRRAMKLLNARGNQVGATGRSLRRFGDDSRADDYIPERDEQALRNQSLTALRPLVRSGAVLSGLALTHHNSVDMLRDGDETFPAMLCAIRDAKHYVLLQSYIMAYDGIGHAFADALSEAQERGVAVRILVDGYGHLQQILSTGTHLKRRGLRLAEFIPFRAFPPSVHLNLRNHRKLLVVDGAVGFTGGVNIWDKQSTQHGKGLEVQDLHFRFRGPIVEQLQQAFAADWEFVEHEALDVDMQSASDAASVGDTLCRVITDVPTQDEMRLLRLYVAAINTAKQSVSIITPYFLPPDELRFCISAAAIRGVKVDIVVPGKIDHKLVEWGCQRYYSEMHHTGVRIWQQPAPFAHTKLLLIDDAYAMIGSCNLDPRALILNFEMNVEIYGAHACAPMRRHFEERLAVSTPLKPSFEYGLWGKLRCGLGWLLSPYL